MTAKTREVKEKFLNNFEMEIGVITDRVEGCVEQAQSLSPLKKKGIAPVLRELSRRLESLRARHLEAKKEDEGWLDKIPVLEDECRRIKTTIVIAKQLLSPP